MEEFQEPAHATFFSSFIQQLSMLTLFSDHIEKGLSSSETSFQKQSNSDTQLFASFPLCPQEPKLVSHPSQHTLPQTLPFNSRALDFEDSFPTLLEHQIAELQTRYQGIHDLLIRHSEYESGLHQRKRNYKPMTVDSNCLSRDYSNKLHLIADITLLVESIANQEEDAQQQLETKFQQYYLERHYGGLSCDFGNLSIQDRLENSKGDRSFSVEVLSRAGDEGKEVLSRIGNYQSLIPQSRITYSQEFCQTGDWEGVVVEVAQLMEVEIPVMVYKLKEVVVRCEESQLLSQFGNIDDIITRYSKPYEDLYESRHDEDPKISESCVTPVGTPLTSSPMPEPSPSMLMQSTLEKQQTEVELAYSDFPDEERFKLPLDSYAQIQSLISNESGIGSRPTSDRATPRSIGTDGKQTLLITEKVLNRSVIQRMEENQRALAEENSELRQSIAALKAQIAEGERRIRELEGQNGKLAGRLEEEIQQSEYFAGKLEQLNAELLQEKVQCLTHLNESKERKIDMLTVQLAAMTEQASQLRRMLSQAQQDCQRRDDLLHLRQEQITSLSRTVFEKQQQLNQLTSCEQNTMQMVGQTELKLKLQIDKLQREKSQLKQSIKQYQKRLLDEGLSLQYDQATEIQGIIESQQHNFNLELQQINQKYDRLLTSYQLELSQLKKESELQKKKEEESTHTIQHLKAKQIKNRILNEQYSREIESVIQEYDKELQLKDQEILSLKRREIQSKNQELKLVLQKSYQFITQLQAQLVNERQQKSKLSSKLSELESIVKKEMSGKPNREIEAELKLISELSDQLERKLQQNRSLKDKIEQQSQQLIKLSCFQGNLLVGRLQEQNKKLRKVNGKLKSYMMGLQQEIRAVWAVEECDVHKNWIDQVLQERDYYLLLATGEGLVPRNSIGSTLY